ncbi:MAG: NAD-dependent epimerase/dehydratase family protein [Kouleothrix sp.]|nr:NAD-dependent epimerase/dehydratase family protein [Kouleothrix sp.]
MELLILGGTVFLGRHLVDAALARGHTVTLFNRGQHNPELYPAVEKLRGDRSSDLSALRGRRWDAVIDTCGYVPRVVLAAAELLSNAVDRYVFISSISVYPHFRRAGIDESAPVGELADPTVEQVDGETYGPLKALCERAAEAALPGRVLTIRPGLIVGPHDPTDRFTYWPQRVARGGEVLAPGRPGRHVQIIDARDLAEWTLRMVESGQAGVYNATGPAYALTMERLLDVCNEVGGGGARVIWLSESFLAEQQVGSWIELPLWVPESDPDTLGFSDVDCSKAIAAGLTFRDLAATVRDTLDWDAARPPEYEWRAGLAAAREMELLARWHA